MRTRCCCLGLHDYSWWVYKATEGRLQASKKKCGYCGKEKPDTTYPKEYQGVDLDTNE